MESWVSSQIWALKYFGLRGGTVFFIGFFMGDIPVWKFGIHRGVPLLPQISNNKENHDKPDDPQWEIM